MHIFIKCVVLRNLITSILGEKMLYIVVVYTCFHSCPILVIEAVYLCVLLSQVCPQLGLCPPAETAVALDATHTVNDKPTCPLCLLATQSIIDKIKDKKTEVRGNL
jgi:hypothetical protein